MKSTSAQRALPWALATVFFLIALVLAAILFIPKTDLFGSEDRHAQVIKSVSKEEEVALLSLGIQDVEEKETSSSLLWDSIPGTERTAFLEYSFTAKLGVDGQEVQINQTGDDTYLVSVPKFIFIGHDDADYKLAREKNGVLSWLTPEISESEMISSILNDEVQQEYVDSHEDLLREQAKVFYGGIINGVDPSLDVEYEFGR